MNRHYLITDLHCAGNRIASWDTMYDYLSRDYHMTHSADCAGKLRALLMFHEEPITDDAFNLAYVQGKAERNVLDDAGKAAKALSMYMSLNDADNEPLIHRYIESAISNVEKEIYNLSRFTLRNDVSMDNYLPHKKEFTIEVKITTDFTDKAIAGLRNSVHDYIVSNILYEWSSLTYPKFAEFWKSKMEGNIANIRIVAERDRYRKMEHITPHW